MFLSTKRPPARRAFLACALTFCASLGLPTVVAAAGYPERPVRMVVPYPPGGATDVIGRVMAQELSLALGQQFVVENRAGATGNIGADHVAKSDPDGYTLLLGALTSHSINAELYKGKVPYDIEKSFAPVSIVGSVPLVFRTANRTVILNLPGQGQRLFRLRLAPSPSQSAEFGPWHLVDEVAASAAAAPRRPNDVYAIRYRVI